MAALFFGFVYFLCGLDKSERQRVTVVLILCVASALFWAPDLNKRVLHSTFLLSVIQSMTGFMVPASWFQSLGASCNLASSGDGGIVGATWATESGPISSVKFGLGLILLGLGFLVLAGRGRFCLRAAKRFGQRGSWLLICCTPSANYASARSD